MTRTNLDQSGLLARHDQGDFLRSIAEVLLQMIMEFEREAIAPVDRSWQGMMSKA